MENELQNKVFHDADKARQWLESHLWPDGPVCGHCGAVDNATPIDPRPGWYQCNEAKCRSQFTVMVGTVFERSHIPLNKWLMAAFLMPNGCTNRMTVCLTSTELMDPQKPGPACASGCGPIVRKHG